MNFLYRSIDHGQKTFENEMIPIQQKHSFSNEQFHALKAERTENLMMNQDDTLTRSDSTNYVTEMFSTTNGPNKINVNTSYATLSDEDTEKELASIEELLQIESLDNEAHVVSILQESSLEFWSSEKHLFCSPLTSHHVYRFLYGFIYDTQQELYQFVTDEMLSQCPECIVAYIKSRQILLTSLEVIYDSLSVSNLNSEYLKWDLKRIMSGINYFITLHQTTQSKDTSDMNRNQIFPNAIFELLFDQKRFFSKDMLQYHPSIQELINDILNVCNEIVTYDQSSFIQPMQYLLIDQRNRFPKILFSSWNSHQPILRQLAIKLTSAIPVSDFTILNDVSICLCSKDFTQILYNWATEIQERMITNKNNERIDHDTLTELQNDIPENEMICVSSNPTQSSSGDTKSQHYIRIHKVNLQNSTTILSSITELMSTGFLLPNILYLEPLRMILQTIFFFIKNCIDTIEYHSDKNLYREMLDRLLHQCFIFIQRLSTKSWSMTCPVLLHIPSKYIYSYSLSLIQCIQHQYVDPSIQLSAFKALKDILSVVSLGLDTPDVVLGQHVCVEWRRTFPAILDVCLTRQPTLINGPQCHDTEQLRRLELRALKRRVLFLVLGLDAQLTIPEELPVCINDDTERTQQRINEPLFLQYKIRLLPILTQVSKNSGLRLETEKEQNNEIQHIIMTAMGRIFDWALADLKYELILLQTTIIEFFSNHTNDSQSIGSIHIPVSISSVSPRSGPIIGLLPIFALSQINQNNELTDIVGILLLRYLADIATLNSYIGLLLDLPQFKVITSSKDSQNMITDQPLNNTYKIVSTQDVRICLEQFQRSINIFFISGTFIIQHLIDRLLYVVINEQQQNNELINNNFINNISPPDKQILPFVNSLELPGRTKTIEDIEMWDFPTDIIYTKDFQLIIHKYLEKIILHPLINTFIRFIFIFICGRLPTFVLTRIHFLTILLLTSGVPSSSPCIQIDEIIDHRNILLCRPNGSSFIQFFGKFELDIVNAFNTVFNHHHSISRILLDSIDVAADVFFEKWDFRMIGAGSVSPTKNVFFANPALIWGRWLKNFACILPSLKRFYEPLLHNDPDNKSGDADILTSIFANGWRALALIVDSVPPAPYQSQHILDSSLSKEENNRQYSEPQQIEQLLSQEATISIILEFLDIWITTACGTLEATIQGSPSNTLDLTCLPSMTSIHIEAMTKHTIWTPGVMRWCIAAQAAQSLKIWNQMSQSYTCVNPSSILSKIDASWRISTDIIRVKSVCGGIAKGMTMTYKYFKRHFSKGSSMLPLLARGELSPQIEEMIRLQIKQPKTPLVLDLTEEDEEEKEKKDDILLLSVNPSIESHRDDQSINKSPIESSLEEHHTTHSQPTLLPKSTCMDKTWKKRGTGFGTVFDFLTGNRKHKTYPFQRQSSKRSGKIPNSLAKKLGENILPRINLRLPSTLPDPHSNDFKTNDQDKAISGSTSMLKPKTRPASTVPLTTLTSKTNSAMHPLSQVFRKPRPNLRPMALDMSDQQSSSETHSLNTHAIQKKIAAERAQSGIQDILQTILEWDIFTLSTMMLPDLNNVSERLPLTFEDEIEFRRCFQPLVLEECRCSLVQGSTEKRLEGFPIRIIRNTRLANIILATAKSDRIQTLNDTNNQHHTTTQETSLHPNEGVVVQDKLLETIPLQPWDLVMLIPRPNTGPDIDGKLFSELIDPPFNGYLIAIVERDDETEDRQFGTKKTLSVKLRMPFRPTSMTLKQLRRIPVSRVSINSLWFAYIIGSLTTSVREFQSLFMSQFSPLFPFILNPRQFGIKRLSANQLPSSSSLTSSQSNNLHSINHDIVDHLFPQSTLHSIRTACQLNESQLYALQYALTVKHGVALLQGPPGTGKTKTLLAILAVLYNRAIKSKTDSTTTGLKKKILVCAPSNAAIDEIAARVLKEGFPNLDDLKKEYYYPQCVRVGNPKRITRPEVLDISLTENIRQSETKVDQTKKTDYYNKREDITNKLVSIDEELRNIDALTEAERFEAAFVDSDTQCSSAIPTQDSIKNKDIRKKQFSDILKQKRLLHQQMMRLKDIFEKDLKLTKSACQDATLHNCDIIFSTLSGSATESLNGLDIQCVIIDEAAQAVEISTLIPLRLEPSQLILIGDPQQLPATVLSKIAKRLSYERSLFQRLQLCGVDVKMLSVQYRMHPDIAAFPAAHFYQNRLENALSVLNRDTLPFHNWKRLFQPFLFFDVPSQENRHSVSQSLSNKEEALFIFSLIRLFRKHFIIPLSTNSPTSDYITLDDIAIITPYKQQVIELRRLFETCSQEFPTNSPEICTIDSFQGREKRIIIFSCVRSDTSRADSHLACIGSDDSAISSTTDEDDEHLHKKVKNEEIKQLHQHKKSVQQYQTNQKMLEQQTTLGFVSDIRRMNVGITRARDSLWIVGNADTLKLNPSWKAMLHYAKGKSFQQYSDNMGQLQDTTELNTSQKQSRHYKKTFIDLRAETHTLQIQLRAQHQRRPLKYASPPMIISMFLSLSEEYNLSKLKQDHIDTQQIKKDADVSTLNKTIPPKTKKSTVKNDIPQKKNTSKIRSLSNCSSVTSSSIDSLESVSIDNSQEQHSYENHDILQSREYPHETSSKDTQPIHQSKHHKLMNKKHIQKNEHSIKHQRSIQALDCPKNQLSSSDRLSQSFGTNKSINLSTTTSKVNSTRIKSAHKRRAAVLLQTNDTQTIPVKHQSIVIPSPSELTTGHHPLHMNQTYPSSQYSTSCVPIRSSTDFKTPLKRIITSKREICHSPPLFIQQTKRPREMICIEPGQSSTILKKSHQHRSIDQTMQRISHSTTSIIQPNDIYCQTPHLASTSYCLSKNRQLMKFPERPYGTSVIPPDSNLPPNVPNPSKLLPISMMNSTEPPVNQCVLNNVQDKMPTRQLNHTASTRLSDTVPTTMIPWLPQKNCHQWNLQPHSTHHT